MPRKPDPTYADLVRCARAFLMTAIAVDAIALRPDRPRVRGPITSLAEKIFRTLLFEFENVLTGLCFPSIATIAAAAGSSDSQTKELLKALRQTQYVTWEHGKRKRVMTRKGWRWVRGSNRYRLLCPFRHLDGLRRELLRVTGGKLGHVIHNLIERYTPPAKVEKPRTDPIQDPAADRPPHPPQAGSTARPAPPSRAPPETEGTMEAGGVTVEDPKLASVLADLWEALKKRGD